MPLYVEPNRDKMPEEIPKSHDDLAHDLAVWWQRLKGWPVWENMAIRKGRPDVFSIKPTFNLNQQTGYAFEIKVSRSDFLQDIKKGKWQQYQHFSSYVYFCCPEGLIALEDLPEGAGLYWRTIEGWKRQHHKKKNPNWKPESRWQSEFMDIDPAKHYGGQLAPKDWMKLAFGKYADNVK